MKNIHFILQGKGGVGKKMISSILSQYYIQMERTVLPIDLDPVNSSLSKFSKLNAIQIELFNNGKIKPRNFDTLIDTIVSAPDNAIIIIDSGASSFVPLNLYMIENSIIQFLIEEANCSVTLHSIIVGGQGAGDTITGLEGLLSNYGKTDPAPNIAVWINPFFGSLEKDGKTFTDSKFYNNYKESITYILNIPNLDLELFGSDFMSLMRKGLTFDESKEDESFSLMAKHRLYKMKNSYFELIQTVGL